MTGRSPAPPRHTVTALVLAGLGLLVLGVALGPAVTVLTPTPTPTPAPTPTPTGEAPVRAALPHRDTSTRAVTDRLHGPALSRSEPLSLHVPGLGLTSPVTGLGLDGSGVLETPDRGDEVGWYTGSATPGAMGPAVLAAHVTWDGRPGAFHALAALTHGDRVHVLRRDGRTAVFEISHVDRFAKSAFPTDAVYGVTDHAALRLITCGGEYDEARDGYPDNVVAFAHLVGSR